MRKTNLILLPILLLTIGFVVSCGNDDEGPTTPDGFDRKAMLENIGQNIILPGYQRLQGSVWDLQTAVEAFVDNPSAGTLSEARSKFNDAYLKWQAVSFYEIGEAEKVFLRGSYNTFPANTITINSNISSGSYNLDAVSNIDAVGLPTIDYLLNGIGDNDDDIIAAFTGDADAGNRGTYLKDLLAAMKTKIDQVHGNWPADQGNFIGSFVAADGTDVGSSLGMLVNALNFHYERFTRDNKIGKPLGIRSLGIPIPANVEARYSGQSIALAVANLEAIRDFYLGQGEQDGLGLHDNLLALESKYEDRLLGNAIKEQMDLAISKVQAIPEPFADTVENNPDPANDAYQELQKLLVLIKADMPSALGVLITYQDNDGD